MKRQSSLLDFAVCTKKQPASQATARRPQAKDCHSSDSDECDDLSIVDQSHNTSSDTSVVSSMDISGQQSSSDSVPALLDTIEKSVPSVSTTEQTPSDIAPNAGHSPCQPLVRFPTTDIAGKQRSFNAQWYKVYDWIEYSVQKDAVFCYPCRLFQSSGMSHNTFTVTGYRDWKHASGKGGILTVHNKCATHVDAMAAWAQYKLNTSHNSTIDQRMESNRAQVIKNNRHYLKALVEVVLLCAQQEIGLRGHRESSEARNRGNFLEILEVLAAHDPIVSHRLKEGPKNAVYTSPEMQNTFLNIMGKMVREQICSEVRRAGMYSILVDETKDCSKTEQMSIALWYWDTASMTVKERFLTFIEAKSLTAEDLTKYIINTLKVQYHLDLDSIVSQGYDGASVMSGKNTGVQKRIAEIVPQAIYIHCFAHILNLVLVDSAKKNTHAAKFFALLESLYVFISSTKAHVVFIEKQKELHPDKPTRELQKLSDTRWACRFSAVDVICRTLDAVLSTLEDIADSDDHAKAVEARDIFLQVNSFSFLITLIIFDRILTCTKSLSDFLQRKNCDLAKATSLIQSTIETLKEYRQQASWDHHFSYSKEVAEEYNIPLHNIFKKRQTRTPRHFEEHILLEPTGSREMMSTSDDYKINLYYSILDTFLVELRERFTSKNMDIMKAIQACSPQSDDFLDVEMLAPLADNYNIDIPSLSLETALAKRTLEKSKHEMETIADVMKEIKPLQNAFPTLAQVLQIALTISVSSASCERSFSALKRIKSFLRSTMTEERLVDLASLSIENDLARQLDFSVVIDKFAVIDKSRRISLI